jgi:hypothetical protein
MGSLLQPLKGFRLKDSKRSQLLIYLRINSSSSLSRQGIMHKLTTLAVNKHIKIKILRRSRSHIIKLQLPKGSIGNNFYHTTNNSMTVDNKLLLLIRLRVR